MQGLGQHFPSKPQVGPPATPPVGKPLTCIRPFRPSYLGGSRKRLFASRSRYDLPVREHHAELGQSAEQGKPLLSPSNSDETSFAVRGRSRIEETLKTLDFLCTSASDQHPESSGHEDSHDDVQVDHGPANPLGGRAVYSVCSYAKVLISQSVLTSEVTWGRL